MFKLNKAKILLKWIITSFVVLSVSACAGFNRSFELQNDYSSEVDITDTSKIYLTKGYNPSVTRGIIESEYTAFIPSGVYAPIFTSKDRTFYQAPEGFEYRARGSVESLVGGLVQVESGQNSQLYVWFFPEQTDYFEIQKNGEWLKYIKPGFLNLRGRPWVEEDLLISLDQSDVINFSGSCIDFNSLDSTKHSILITDISEKLQPLARKYHFYPKEARKNGLEGVVVVDLVMDEFGEIENYSISESSGHKILDNATLQTFESMSSQANSLIKEGICLTEKITLELPMNYMLR